MDICFKMELGLGEELLITLAIGIAIAPLTELYYQYEEDVELTHA